jgi:hypothetical protein
LIIDLEPKVYELAGLIYSDDCQREQRADEIKRSWPVPHDEAPLTDRAIVKIVSHDRLRIRNEPSEGGVAGDHLRIQNRRGRETNVRWA